ncbi:S-layer homology domain-containing protein [Paenibacillus alba]|uniref:S-layer homology domain-containing protein n=1 Tax=Paenibacillus alba TaxID=1197127 RepID=UPI0015655A40|nr:S-layer homology domain-containing protein [Paenibacillus alba]
MKRFSLRSLFVLSTLILVVLSGCVSSTSPITFNFPNDKLNDSEQLFVRFSDGNVTQVPYNAGASTTTVNNPGPKTIVGGYVSNGVVSWVPNYSFVGDPPSAVNVSGIAAQKPVLVADHVKLTKPPETQGQYVSVTFAVYDKEGKLVDGQTEVFAHSAKLGSIFYNTDPFDKSGYRVNEVNEGFSTFTVNGEATFLIKSTNNPITTEPLSLYSGSKLISNDPFRTGTNLVTSMAVASAGNVSTLQIGGTVAMSATIMPVEATNKTFTWSVDNGTGSATINASGVLTGTSAGTVTVKAAANDESAKFGSKIMTIQSTPVTDINITTPGNVSSLTIGDTLAMSAEILPIDATNKAVTWSVENGTGSATINASGVLTGTSAGTITVLAHANDQSEAAAFKTILIKPTLEAFAGGSGTPSDPFQIANAEQLSEIRYHLDTYKNYRLIADITSFPSVEGGWQPIGDNDFGFQGNFDGNGFIIRNLTINRPQNSYLGLFGVTETNSEISHIRLEDMNVAGSSQAGGLVGYNKGTIRNSSVTGSVEASSAAGGLVGVNEGTISRSFAEANVSSDYGSGGLVGNNATEGTISNSYAAGSVYGYNGVGGLAGSSNGGISNSYAIGNIKPHPNSTPNNLGGLTAYSQFEIINSYFNTETTGQTDNGLGKGLSTEAMKIQQTYEQWDFASIWAIHASRNNGYPYLRDVQFYVDYDGNGSTSGTPPTDGKAYSKGVTANVYSQDVDLVKTGYTFAGWNTKTDGSGTSYAAGSTIAITGDTILYSRWLENTPASIPVTAITVSSNTYSVYVGEKLQLNAVVAPSNATNTGVTWTVSQGSGNASISAEGVLTGLTAGTVTVTATSVENAAIKGSVVVTVAKKPDDTTSGSGSGSGSGSVTPPSVDPKPETKPENKPENKTEVKFNDKVVNFSNVLAKLNQKIEEAKVAPSVTFKDTNSHWADATVSIFVKLGVVNGYADGTFHPNASITRAEFATIIAKVFDLSATGSGNKLKDTSGHWAESSINALTASGIISGYEDGTFKPNKEITRAEIISMISKLITIKAGSTPATTVFTDINGAWNKEQIEAAASAGLISGEGNGLFSPNKQSTRAEALTIVLHVLQANPDLNALLGTIK